MKTANLIEIENDMTLKERRRAFKLVTGQDSFNYTIPGFSAEAFKGNIECPMVVKQLATGSNVIYGWYGSQEGKYRNIATGAHTKLPDVTAPHIRTQLGGGFKELHNEE